MLLRNLADVRELFGSLKGSFVGAGITAFSRITPCHFLESYQIVCLRRTLDLPLIRQNCPVLCLEEERGQRLQVINSFQLLDQASMRDAMASLPAPRYALLYQNYPELEGLAVREGWHLLANPPWIRNQVGSRAAFKKMVQELRLPAVRGEIVPVRRLQETDYGYWVRTLGASLVIQLPDVSQGGGRGTFFVASSREFRQLQDRLKAGTWRGIPLTAVSVNEHVEGLPVSMALCITRHGLLMSRLQRQLIDLSYCEGMAENGVFCGHVWDDASWPDKMLLEGQRQGRLIGGYLARLGYRGIFGVDFILDDTRNRLVPIELNPRYTGAFPVLSLLHMEKQLIPMEAFHMLEFIGAPYRVHVEELNDGYASALRGSHLLLFLPARSKSISWRNLKAGLYQYDSRGGGIAHREDTLHINRVDDPNRFVVVDGPPAWPVSVEYEASNQDPLTRLCRLLFSEPVVNPDGLLSPAATGALAGILDHGSGGLS
jgi:hypothetical protein